VVVISPPGGLGEIASVEAARLGGSVRWFVVSAPSPSGSAASSTLALTSDTLAAIEQAGGSIELAGSDAESLLLGSDDGSSAASAVASWCRGTKSVICTYDGDEEEKRRVDRAKTADDRELGNEVKAIRSGIRVAAREAIGVASSGATKVAMLYSGDEMGGDANKEKKGGLLQGLFGGNAAQIPDTLSDAMKGSINVIRYGELFGAAESSPESSPFIGGPRRDPVVRDMYTMRSIRMDPTISVSGNILSGGSKSNRLAIGAAATRLGLGKINIPSKIGGIDVSLSSFAGTDGPTEEEWNAEFNRVSEMLSSPTGGATLFSADFSSVPSTKRMAEWIATKWAPAILRSYDIAGIRVGARPVYAVQTADDTVELVWQELVDFNSVTSGKMIVQVSENGMTASRGGGDAAAGFGAISMKPLPGEDILVRRLGDAASQAIEKGLAVKPIVTKDKPKAEVVAEPIVVAAVAATSEPVSTDSGPRSAGARRSSERSRGKRRVKSESSEES